MSTIGKRLNIIREWKGLTLEEFGKHLGYGKGRSSARQIMSRILNDHRKPTLQNLKQLQLEGIDINWLLNGIGELDLSKKFESGENDVKYHFYNGPKFIETVVSRKLEYPNIINMQGNEIYTVKINSEMMFPTIKIGDTVNAVKVEKVIEDGLYVCINEVEGRNILWIKRMFYDTNSGSFNVTTDNPNYPNYAIDREIIDANKLNLRVFSIMLTVDNIS